MDDFQVGTKKADEEPIQGQDEERWRIVENLHDRKYRVVLIVGKILTGKVFFAEKVARDLQIICRQQGLFVEKAVIVCKGVETWDTFLRHVATSLNMAGNDGFAEYDIKAEISRRLNGRTNTTLLLLFTKCEDLAAGEILLQTFCHFSENLLWNFDQVWLMMTSRTYFRLSYPHPIYVTNLNPLSVRETVPVLYHCVPHFKISNVQQLLKLAKACWGRPPLLLKLAHILQNYKGVISIENCLDTLQNTEKALEVFSRHPSPEGNLKEEVERLLCRLPKPLQNDLISLSALEGSFGFQAAAAKLAEENIDDLKVRTIIPLHQLSILDFDMKLNRISIDPFIQAFIRQKYPDVGHGDLRRKEIEDFLWEILIQIRREVCVKTVGRVLGYPYDDFSELETAITEAFQMQRDPFAVYMKVVKKEEGFMANLSPHKAERFYIAMFESSKKFGSPKDQIFMKGVLGRALTESKGWELVAASNMLAESIRELEGNESQYYQILFNRQLAWNNIQQGK